nr:hypothetical protein CFP56_11067 [Quercus suber]
MAIWAGIGIIRPRKAEGRKTIEPRSMAFSPARGQQYNMLEVQVQCDQISRGLVESVASPGRDENPYDGSDVNPFQFVEAQIMPQRCDALLCSECCRYLKAAESCETRKDPEEARSLRERNGMLVRMLYNVKCTYQRLESEAQGTPWTRPKPGEVFRPVLSFRSLFIPEQFTRFSADLLVG